MSFLVINGCALFEKRETERVPAEEKEVIPPEQEKGIRGDVDNLMKDRAELRAEVDSLKSELTSLKGEIEAHNRQFEAFASWEKRISDLEMGLRELSLKKDEKIQVKASAQELYKMAKKDFQDKKYNEAAFSLKTLVEKFPKSLFVPEAHYLMGEAYFELKDYETAILEFDIVRKKFSKSKFVVSALYSEALSLEKIESLDESKVLLKIIVEQYPKNKLSKKAKLDLKRLENIKQPKKQ